MIIIPLFLTNFKYTNFDLDKLTFKQLGTTIYVDAFYIPSVTCCPICGSTFIKRIGYAEKKVKHCTNYTWLYIVNCHIQRYQCKNCYKRFFEKDTFSNPYECLSKETIFAILDQLKLPNETFESVGKSLHLSRQEVINIFDKYIDYKAPTKLPKIMSWDEKSINKRMTDNPYIFTMVDFLNNKIYDILPSRHKNYLTSYFSKIPFSLRNEVEYITIDMWESYLDLARIYFPKAKVAIDSFHVVKHVSNALDSVRKSIMNKYNNNADEIDNNTEFYYLLKKYKYILLSEFDTLSDKKFYNRKLQGWYDKYSIRELLLNIDPKLKTAYQLYSRYLEFNKITNYNDANKELETLLDEFFYSGIKQFVEVAKTISHWKEYILNSFILVESVDGSCMRRLSNGPIEGINSILEKININGNGYTNFFRFRNRAIYCVNKDVPLKNI